MHSKSLNVICFPAHISAYRRVHAEMGLYFWSNLLEGIYYLYSSTDIKNSYKPNIYLFLLGFESNKRTILYKYILFFLKTLILLKTNWSSYSYDYKFEEQWLQIQKNKRRISFVSSAGSWTEIIMWTMVMMLQDTW